MTAALKQTFTLDEYERISDKYQLIFNSMTTGLAFHEIILDDYGVPCDYRFLEVNPAFEVLIGLKASEIVGRTVLEVLPGLEPHWIEVYGRVALTGKTIRFEQYSKELKLYFEIQAFCPEKGKFGCLVNDITESKEIRAKLEESERYFRTLVEKMGDVIACYNKKGERTYISPQFEEIFGKKREDLLGKSILETDYPRGIALQLDTNLQRTFKEKKETSCCIVFPHSKLGMRAVEVRFFPVFLGDEVVSAISQSRDVTEWFHFEEESRNDSFKKALVVDDEPSISFILANLLLEMGFDVNEAASAKEALELLKIREYDLVLTDHKMPEMCGNEFVQEAKRLYPFRATKFISVSGDIEDDSERKKLYDALINKPFEIAQIKTLLRRFKE